MFILYRLIAYKQIDAFIDYTGITILYSLS